MDIGIELKADFYCWLAETHGDGKIDRTKNVITGPVVLSEGLEEIRFRDWNFRGHPLNNSDVPRPIDLAFKHVFKSGLSLKLGESKSVSMGVELSVGLDFKFVDFGTSFEINVTTQATRELSTSTEETTEEQHVYHTEVLPGSPKTVIALYFDMVTQGTATANGIQTKFEDKRVTTLSYLYEEEDEKFSEAELRQKVAEVLADFYGLELPLPLELQDFRYAPKEVPDPLNAANVSRVEKELEDELSQRVETLAKLEQYKGKLFYKGSSGRTYPRSRIVRIERDVESIRRDDEAIRRTSPGRTFQRQ